MLTCVSRKNLNDYTFFEFETYLMGKVTAVRQDLCEGNRFTTLEGNEDILVDITHKTLLTKYTLFENGGGPLGTLI
eukprot:3880486-Amphidinium_carterae.1